MKALPKEEKKFKEVVKKHVNEQLLVEEEAHLDYYVQDHTVRGNVFKIVVDPREPREIPKDNSDEASDDAERYRKLFERLKAAARAASGALLWDEACYEDEEANASDDKSDPPTGCDAPAEGSADAAADVDKLADERSKPVSRSNTSSSLDLSFPASVGGRGTCSYWAVKLPNESEVEEDFEIAFLKDTWRIPEERMEVEGDIMDLELVEEGVVSGIFCQGDVRQDDTSSAFLPTHDGLLPGAFLSLS